jgi:rhodanese-related sulfurtransferase
VNLFDAREKINVFANQMVGKGGEKSESYCNCNISYNNLPNMPVIQTQYSIITDWVADFLKTPVSFSQMIGESKWMKSLSLLLTMTVKMVNSLKTGRSVFVHCSDGWDRTAQASALCQLILDPYYRTLEGFMVLIEKEFCQTGHMLAKRLAVYSRDSGNISPIFLQFLDAVHNIMFWNKDSFQFQQNLLVDLSQVTYFGVFVNFLCNSEKERQLLNIRHQGMHVFDFFNFHKFKYINSSFLGRNSAIDKVLVNETNLRFWKEHFFRYFEPDQSSFEVPLIF